MSPPFQISKSSLPECTEKKYIDDIEKLSEAVKIMLQFLGIASVLVFAFSGSSVAFLTLLGCQKYLFWLPIVNLNYTPGLEAFFRGISVMNFQMLSLGKTISKLPFKRSGLEKDSRFTNAGL